MRGKTVKLLKAISKATGAPYWELKRRWHDIDHVTRGKVRAALTPQLEAAKNETHRTNASVIHR